MSSATLTTQLPTRTNKPPIHHGKRTNPTHKHPYSQAVEIQRKVMELTRRDDLTPSALSSLAKTWNDLEDQKRAIRGRDLACGRSSSSPSDARPSKRERSAAGSGSFEETPPSKSAPARQVAESPPPTTEATSGRASERTTDEGDKESLSNAKG